MSRMVGTVSRGLRAPIIRAGDDLVEIVTGSIVEAMKEDGLAPRDRDVVAMTESIVARAQGNYATVDDIAADVKAKIIHAEIYHKIKINVNCGFRYHRPLLCFYYIYYTLRAMRNLS